MKKTILLLLSIALAFACSKDGSPKNESSIGEQANEIKLNLTLVNNNSFSSNFAYDYSPELENVKIIWNKGSSVTTSDNIGEEEITDNNSNITINNLEPKSTYYFKLKGTANGVIRFSEEVQITTSEMKITFNNQILNSFTTNSIENIIKTDDGYILATRDQDYPNQNGIRITKINFQFNLQWTFVINEGIDPDILAGILELSDNTYIGIARKSYYEVFGFKFDQSGNVLWTKNYNSNSGDNLNDIIKFKNLSKDLKFMLWADDTNNGDSSDAYYRALTLNSDGDIISTKILQNANDYNFYNLYYDKNGSMYNYGTDASDGYFKGIIEKYDIDYNLKWSQSYNNGLPGSDRLDQLLITENNIVNIGIQTEGNYKEYRLIHLRELDGTKINQYIETKDTFSFQGKDINSDFDGGYLALFLDLGSYYRSATLLKIDADGNILWTFIDGKESNDDKFYPSKVFYQNGEYLIFGVKDGNKVWLKKVKIE